MFRIVPFDKSFSCKTVQLRDDVFHQALKLGEKRYHVISEKGESKYDIIYIDNNSLEPPHPGYVKGKTIPCYYSYNEYDKESIFLDFFMDNGITSVFIEEANEYTVAIAKVVVLYTDMHIYSLDERISDFLPLSNKLHIVSNATDFATETTFYIQKSFKCGLEDNNFKKLSSIYAFHNLFFLQWLTNGESVKKFKFIKNCQNSEFAGIGAILFSTKRLSIGFKKVGLTLVNTGNRFGKYPRTMIEKYFNIEFMDNVPDECSIQITEMLILLKTYFYAKTKFKFDYSILKESFKTSIEEYYNQQFKEQKILGVLVRGTDYVKNNIKGVRSMATAEKLIPIVRNWFDEGLYDKIFVATEDADALETLKKEFGKNIVYLDQNRYSVMDLKQGQTIADLERSTTSSDEERMSIIEDTLKKYLYALVILSKCDSFVCSGQCNGYNIVMELNDGKFKKTYKYCDNSTIG